MKTLFSKLFIFCMLAFLSIAANAQSEIPSNEIWYTSTYEYVIEPNNYRDFGANIVSNEYKDGKGIITFNGNVTSIGENAFSCCSGLTSITIPNSVKWIGGWAFAYCSALTSITIPNSVKSIGDYAFYDCSGLRCITIPNSVTEIKEGAFYECSGLTSITISNSVTLIEANTFARCSGLKSITIPHSVKSVGRSAFSNSGLTSITIPNSVTSIGEDAFASCFSLTSITIPNSVKSIGRRAFYRCKCLTDITIPNSVTSLEESTFEGCISLTNVTIPSSVKSIGPFTFCSCDSLNSITIPNSVTEIGNYAFYSCQNLTKVTIPNSVTKIGDGVFIDCRSLTDITIPNSVTKITEELFEYCSNLKNITIPNSVTSIEYAAFSCCTSLKKITIPNSVISIGEDAFAYCDSLTNIIIPSSVTSIGSYAFEKCNYPNPFIVFLMAKTPPSYCLDDAFSNHYPYYAFIPKDSYKDYMAHEMWHKCLTTHSTTYAYKGFEGSFESLKKAQGITADGTSQLFMPDFHCETDNDVHIDDEFTLWEIGEDENLVTDDEQLVGTFEKDKVESWGQKGYIFTAPNEFIDSENNKDSLVLRAFANASVKNIDFICPLTNINLYRPGVALVHGLFSDGSCFAKLGDYLEENGYSCNQIRLVDYKPSNKASFAYNTYEAEIIKNNLKSIYETLLINGIVSSKYDLVGHSMGGILSRLYAQKINKDAVHKIITLDTPHLGSQIADLGEKSVIPSLDNIASKLLYNPLTLPISLVLYQMKAFYDKSENDAFRDLATYSEAIKDLNGSSVNNLKDIPCHSICSILGDEDNNISEGDKCSHEDKNSLFYNIVHFYDFLNNSKKQPRGKQILDNLFGEPSHDGVVSLTSQRGGLDERFCTSEYDSYKGMFGVGSNTHHINTNQWTLTFENIKYLLDAKTESGLFSMNGYKPIYATMNSKKSANEGNEIPNFIILDDGTSFIKMRNLSWKKSNVDSISFKIDCSSNIVASLVLIYVGDDRFLCSSNDSHPQFILNEIPSDSIVQIVVIGRTEKNELVFDSKNMTYKSFIEDKIGDANDDGIVDVSDITSVASYILGRIPETFNINYADVDADGNITISDITGIASIILH